jgi:Mor family transcriptional regulator
MKDVKDFPRYKVSKEGKVYSFVGKKDAYELKPQMVSQSKKKYLQIRLFNEEFTQGKLFYLHKLVWETFVGDVPKGYEINHKDENPRNCDLDNLELLTRKNNVLEYYRNKKGFVLRDKRDEIIKDYETLKSYADVAAKWGCSETTIFRVIKNKFFVKRGGKNLIVDSTDKIVDFYTQNDMRNTNTREQLGMEPCRIGRKGVVRGDNTANGSEI